VLVGDDAESLSHNRSEVPVKFLIVVADEDVSRCQFGGIAIARKYQPSAGE
jgi:hypothetical protein